MVYVNIFAYFEGRGRENGKVICENRSYGYGISLSYYPRNYDAYEEPVEIRSLEEGAVVAISVAVITGVYVNQVRNLQVITTTVADLTGKISVTWFNAPYLRSAVRKGSRFVLRGRVVRKQGKLQMEHPEIFTPAAYEEILHSLQPIYGLTAGLSNKTIVKLIHQVLMSRSFRQSIWQMSIRRVSPGRQEFCDSCDSFSQKYAGAVSCKEKVGV